MNVRVAPNVCNYSEQKGQSTCNVTVWCLRVTIADMETRQCLHYLLNREFFRKRIVEDKICS